MTRINRPIPFTGSDEEAIANMETHHFEGDYDEPFLDWRCIDCDCKPWHVAAKYPCGVEPEREDIVVSEDYDMKDMVQHAMDETKRLKKKE